jgi:phage gp36-like protein
VAYCEKADLAEKYGEKELAELTDEQSGAATSDAEVSAACAAASAEVDRYLGVRYPVPLASPPPDVVDFACVIARFKLWGDRATEGTGMRSAYDDVMKMLRDIAAGKAVLSGIPVDAAQVGAVVVAVSERTQVMSDTELSKMLTSCP